MQTKGHNYDKKFRFKVRFVCKLTQNTLTHTQNFF